ncbi:hypothetical protein Q4Q52_14875 [Shewanella sp. SP1S2-4]|nr:hypothetical protein [Shewanella sp. SP1S2-4]MDT3321040.1 hypothetical protein [Shewanella sp. SP1S2-4]
MNTDLAAKANQILKLCGFKLAVGVHMLTHQIGVVAQLLTQQISVLHHRGNKALLHQLKAQQSKFGGLEFEIFPHLSHPHGRGLQRQPRGQALPALLRLAIEDNFVIRQLQQSAAQHHLPILAEAIEHLIGKLVG